MEIAMPRLRLDLDTETFESLVAHATAELRPVQLQAEVLLRRALGLPFPFVQEQSAISECDSDEKNGTTRG